MRFRYLRLLLILVSASGVVANDSPAFLAEKDDEEIPKRPITAASYLEHLGILTFTLKSDQLAEGSTVSTWRRNGEEKPTKLSFEDVPPNREVKVVLWLDEPVTDGEDKSSGLRFRIHFEDGNDRKAMREGTITFPKGVKRRNLSLESHTEPGHPLDEATVLTFRERNTTDPDRLCELRLPIKAGVAKDRSRAMDATKLYSATGVLGWRILLPRDLSKGEHMAFVWLYGGKKQEESGLDTRMIPGGQEVRTFVWLDDWREGDEKGQIAVQFYYKDNKGNEATSGAYIEVPETFTDIYSYLGPGDGTDGAWVLMLTNRFSDDPYRSIFLEPYYRIDEP